MRRQLAEEALMQVTVMSIGSGSCKQEHSRRVLSQWQRHARRADDDDRPVSGETLRMRIARAGIAIVE